METLYIDMKINFVCSLWKIYYYFFDKVEDLVLNIVVKFSARLLVKKKLVQDLGLNYS
jgi:hypothetical protein